MELKSKNTTTITQGTNYAFNRTAYGIEISLNTAALWAAILLIAPLMELK